MFNKIKNNKNNQGQIAIIVLLVSAIMLTLGLSASKKAITDTKVDTGEELLKEAFNTAESGINNYLNNGGNNYSGNNGSSAVVSSSSIGGGDTLPSEGKISASSSQLFWLVNHDAATGSIGTTYYPSNTTVTLKVDDLFTNAIKIDYFYKLGNNYGVSRTGYNFNNSPKTVEGYAYSPSKTVSINIGNENPLLIVITPLSSATNLILSGTSSFPLQGEELTSIGTAGDGIKTQVKTRNTYQIPVFFTEAITAKNVIQ